MEKNHIKKPDVRGFFDEETFTISYIVTDLQSGKCAIIDPVLNYDMASGRTGEAATDRLIAYIEKKGLQVEWILETHVHADHLSSAPYLQKKFGGKTAISNNIVTVQNVFGDLFNRGPRFYRDGRQFDRLLGDGENFIIGTITCRVMHTPGHTPACATYICGDAVFVGDTLFMPDYGTARCDFPGGDAHTLYRSVQKILALPDDYRLFMCHDYAPGGRDYAWETTVAEERKNNIHIHEGISEEKFVTMRTNRDATLDMPKLIIPSVQINMEAGHPPEPEDNGTVYLKFPLNIF